MPSHGLDELLEERRDAVEGLPGVIVIRPDGSHYVARAMPDPLAHQKPV